MEQLFLPPMISSGDFPMDFSPIFKLASHPEELSHLLQLYKAWADPLLGPYSHRSSTIGCLLKESLSPTGLVQ